MEIVHWESYRRSLISYLRWLRKTNNCWMPGWDVNMSLESLLRVHATIRHNKDDLEIYLHRNLLSRVRPTPTASTFPAYTLFKGCSFW